MNEREFMQYIFDHFDVAGEFTRMLVNVIGYAQGFDDPDEGLDFLCDMLDCTIGIRQDEIRQLKLGEE